MHQIMLNASPLFRSHLIRESTLQTTAIFFYPTETKAQKSSQCLFPACSHPCTSLYPLCTHFPCKTRAWPTCAPPALFCLRNTTSDMSESEEKLLSRQRKRESDSFLFTCSLIFTSVATAHKHRRACVDILKWEKI